jgi:hypothetical protein
MFGFGKKKKDKVLNSSKYYGKNKIIITKNGEEYYFDKLDDNTLLMWQSAGILDSNPDNWKFLKPDKSIGRKGWTETEKKEVRIRQQGVCNECKDPPPRWEYHHINGKNWDNNMKNCEGLCPNCHSIKTHEG